MNNLTLQEVLNLCKEAGYDDYKAVELFLCQNASEAGELLYKVMSHRVNELEVFENDTKALMCHGTPYYYKDYDNVTASKLDTLTRKMMMQMPFAEKDIEFMKSFDMSQCEKGGPFWHDLYEAIKGVQIEGYSPQYYNYRRKG